MIRKFILLICFLISAQAIASEDKSFFWKLESERATVYLLGSIHYADESFYPLRSEIEKAYEASDTLVVEIIMDAQSASSYGRLVASEGSYSGDETIKDHISKETYTALVASLEKLGIPIGLVRKQKPGILILTLASAYAHSLGLDSALGIDAYFLSKAANKKNVIALESIDDQLRIFLDIPNGDLMLKESLYSMSGAEELIIEMVDAWKNGDDKKMYKLLFEDALDEYPEFSTIYERLFYQRNITMANAIKAFLNNKGDYFVVIGAGHFLGKEGIINLLGKAGYRVERI